MIITKEKLISLLGDDITPYASMVCDIMEIYESIPDLSVDQFENNIVLHLSWEEKSVAKTHVNIDSMKLAELRARSLDFSKCCSNVQISFHGKSVSYTLCNPDTSCNMEPCNFIIATQSNRPQPDTVSLEETQMYMSDNTDSNIKQLCGGDSGIDEQMVQRVIHMYINSNTHTQPFSAFHEDTEGYSRLVLRGVDNVDALLLMRLIQDPLVSASRVVAIDNELHVDFLKTALSRHDSTPKHAESLCAAPENTDNDIDTCDARGGGILQALTGPFRRLRSQNPGHKPY